jgi:hypothetical protein
LKPLVVWLTIGSRRELPGKEETCDKRRSDDNDNGE